MDKKKFITDVFGEMNEKYLPYVDEVIANLPEQEQIIVRLKYNNVPFTKICKLIKRKPTSQERYFKGITTDITISVSTVRNMFKTAIKDMKLYYVDVWNGEVIGKQKNNMGNNSWDYREDR